MNHSTPTELTQPSFLLNELLTHVCSRMRARTHTHTPKYAMKNKYTRIRTSHITETQIYRHTNQNTHSPLTTLLDLKLTLLIIPTLS